MSETPSATARELRRIADVLDANPYLPMPDVWLQWHSRRESDMTRVLQAFPVAWEAGSGGDTQWAQFVLREPGMLIQFSVYVPRTGPPPSPSDDAERLIAEAKR
jgi:hypothetical protein